jgi:hypothetical protein
MRKLQQTFGLSLQILVVILFVNIVFASNVVLAIPGVPHQFYGEVRINGNLAQDGVEIAVYDKDESKYVAGTFTKNGVYGYDSIFYVLDPDGDRNGHTLEFYVSGVKAAEYVFENGMSTRLDLAVEIPNFCGDGICDSRESCTSCSEDCGSCSSGGMGASGASGSSGGYVSYIPTENETKENKTINEKEINKANETQKTGNVEETCEENWKCTDWFECFNGKQRRNCIDLNNCGTENNKPEIVRDCEVISGENREVQEKEKQNLQLFTGRFLTSPQAIFSIVASIILILGILLYKKRKR